MPKALVIGCTGQDGSILAEFLCGRLGWDCVGTYRRSSVDNLVRVRHLLPRLTLAPADLLDPLGLATLIRELQPDELYNMADQDHVGFSEATPAYSMAVTCNAVAFMLEAVRQHSPRTKVFQPLSATMFGRCPPPQNEGSPVDPQSPYATAKLAAWEWCRHYRAKGVDVRTAIFFNHDSKRRGPDYLLQKIARGAVAYAKDWQQTISVGDPDALVDIGYAPEYMDAAMRIMRMPVGPDRDYCVGTGRPNRIRELCHAAVDEAGAVGVGEFIQIDRRYQPRGETLVADCAKVKEATGWEATSDAEAVVRRLVRGLTGNLPKGER